MLDFPMLTRLTQLHPQIQIEMLRLCGFWPQIMLSMKLSCCYYAYLCSVIIRLSYLET